MNTNATLAALCIFNGLKLSPIVASPVPGFTHIGPHVSPHFEQCRNYLNRFFDDSSTLEAFAPLESFGETMAAAPWIRGAVGILQYVLHGTAGLDIPDADMMDPAAWFEGLPDLVGVWNQYQSVSIDPIPVFNTWKQPVKEPGKRFTARPQYLTELYAKARALQAQDAFLVNPQAIARARIKEGKAAKKD